MRFTSPEGEPFAYRMPAEQAMADFKDYVIAATELKPDQQSHVQYLIYHRIGEDPAIIEFDIRKGLVIIDKTSGESNETIEDDNESLQVYIVQSGKLLVAGPGSVQHECDDDEEAIFLSELGKRSEVFQVTVELGYRLSASDEASIEYQI